MTYNLFLCRQIEIEASSAQVNEGPRALKQVCKTGMDPSAAAPEAGS